MKKIWITAQTKEGLIELLREEPLDLNCGGPDRKPDGTFTVEAYASEEQISRLRQRSCSILEIEDMESISKERQAEVGKGDRFKGGRTVPKGTGVKQ